MFDLDFDTTLDDPTDSRSPEREEHDDHDRWIDARREDRDDHNARW